MAESPKSWDDLVRPEGPKSWDDLVKNPPKTTAADYGRAAMAGFAGVGEAIGKGLRYVGAEDAGQWLQKAGSEAAQSWIGWMTPAGQRALGNEIITDDLSMGETPWQSLGLQAAMSLPSMIATAPVGAGAAAGISKIGGKALETLATRPGTIGFLARFAPSAVAYGGSEGAMAALQNAAQTETEMLSAPIETLRNHPNFQRLYNETDPSLPPAQREQQAREATARLASDEVAWKTFASTGGIGALTGGGALGGLDRMLRTGAKDGIVKAVAKGAAQEAIQEAPQSAAEQLIQNKARKDYLNPDQRLGEGVVSASASGGLVGGVMGGVFGGAGRIARPRSDDEAMADTITGISSAKTVDEAIAVATAAVNTPDDIPPPAAPPPALDTFDGVGMPPPPDAGLIGAAMAGTPTQVPGEPIPPLPETIPPTQTAGASATAVDAKAHEAATSDLNELPQPTEAQKEAGNYRKGHVLVGGLDISVENPAGTKRREEWPTLESHYGYVKGVAARAPDKEHVDVFVKPGTAEGYAGSVFVVDQAHADGKFDEPKVMVGFDTEADARAAYLKNYTPGWESRVLGITPMSMEQFRARLADPQGFMQPQQPIAMISGKNVRLMNEKALLQALKAGNAGIKALAQAELDRRAAETSADGLDLQPRESRPGRTVITPSEDTVIGKNAAGEQLYERAGGGIYRMQNGRPNFGGDLAPVVKADTKPEFLPVPEVMAKRKAGTGEFNIGDVYQWTHPNRDFKEYDRSVIVAGQRVGDKVPVYSFTGSKGMMGLPPISAIPEFTPISELSVRAEPRTDFSGVTVTEVPPAPFVFRMEGGKSAPVQSLADALAKWGAYRDATGGGVSEVGNGGTVYDKNGKPVARISYNGRMWDPETDREIIAGEAKAEADAPALPAKQDKDVAAVMAMRDAMLQLIKAKESDEGLAQAEEKMRDVFGEEAQALLDMSAAELLDYYDLLARRDTDTTQKPAATPNGNRTNKDTGTAPEHRAKDGDGPSIAGKPVADMASSSLALAAQMGNDSIKAIAIAELDRRGHSIGATDAEVEEAGKIMSDAVAGQEADDFKVTHVFDPPAKGEIVRAEQKARVYHDKHGWMTVEQAKAKIAEWKAHTRKQGEGTDNSDKIVLSLFDLTGSWSAPWVEAGYDVYRFDIQDDPENGDVEKFSTEFFNDVYASFEGRDIYAILAACPCTDFAVSGARHFAAKDADGRTVRSVELVRQTQATIEYFKPAVWALENPVGRIEKLTGLPPWRMSFDPNHFGDPYTKKTLIWGRFNADLPVVPVEPTEGSKMWAKFGGKSQATKNARSATPEGFAYAFFMANNAIDNPVMAISNQWDRLDRDLIQQAVDAGVTAEQIKEAVEDFYYQDLDDAAANKAIRDLIAGEAVPEQSAGTDDFSDLTLDEAENLSTDDLRRAVEYFRETADADARGAGRKSDEQIMLDALEEMLEDRATERGESRPLGFRMDEGERLSPLTKALNDLAETQAKIESQGTIVDDRLLERERRQKAIIKELQAEPPTDASPVEPSAADAASVSAEDFDALISEVQAERKQEVAPEPQPAPKPTPMEKAPPGGWSEADKVPPKKPKEATDERPKDDDGNPIYKKGERVEFTSGRYEGRHGEISVASAYTMRTIMVFGGAQRDSRTSYMYQVRTDNGAEVSAPVEQFQLETDKPATVVPDIKIANQWVQPDVVYRQYQGYVSGANNMRARAGRARKDENKQSALREAERSDENAKIYRKAFDDWAAQYPEEAEKIRPATAQAKTTAPATTESKDGLPGMTVVETKHTKTGEKLWVVNMNKREEYAVFKAMEERAKQFGGYYNRSRAGMKGYTFKTEAAAREFMGQGAKTEAQPTAADLAADVASRAAAGVKEGFAGLDALFGRKGTLGSGPAFDEETWAKAKPHFEAAYAEFVAAGKSLKEFVKHILDSYNDAIVPYLKRWHQEVSNAVPERQETAGNDPGSDEGERAGAVPASEPGESTERVRPDEGLIGDPAVQRADEPGVTGRHEAGSVGAERGIFADSPSVDAAPAADRGDGAGTGTGVPDGSAGGNYLAPVGSLARQGSWLETAKRNVQIIKLVKALEADARLATPQEQSLISLYTGFGASEIANGLFPVKYEYSYGRRGQSTKKATGEVDEDALKPGWKELFRELQGILDPKELATLTRSTQYAHYTAEPVIRSIWNAVTAMGFPGGKILEPGMGTGLFMVAAPEGVAQNSKYVGVEMDHMTASIAKQLLQKQNIIQDSFIDHNFPDNFFDMAIGNPPFAGWPVLADPRYRKNAFLLHDYFFAKTIDRVRPGGLLVFVTSAGTMNKLDDKAREYIADRADLLGAIRLPQTAFKQSAGTEVVTDILFLQKRQPGQARGGEAWNKVDQVEVKGDDDAPTTVGVNEYFVAHPEMVLGTHSATGSMYRANSYTVLPLEGDIESHFAKAAEKLPKAVYTKAGPKKTTAEIKEATDRQDFDTKASKEGGLYLADDGEVMQVRSGVGVPLSSAMNLTPDEKAWLKDYIPLRDALKTAQLDQLQEGPWEASQKALQKLYKAFVKKHGRILAHTVTEREKTDEDGEVTVTRQKRFKRSKLLKSTVDVEITLAMGLEKISEDSADIADGDILTTRVLNKPGIPRVETAQDALAATLNERGTLDIDDVARLIGRDPEAVIKELGELIYEDPGAGWQLADEYLSGNVVRKLEEARAAAETDARFERNVTALLNVQPKPLGPADFEVRLGANWIPAADVQAFTGEVMGDEIAIDYDIRTNIWTVEGDNLRRERTAGSDWGSVDRSAAEILSSVLNNKDLTVRKTGADKKTFVDKDATAKVTDIAEKMREAFKGWIWTDADRAKRLLEDYNRRYNNLAPRQFDGSFLTLPGLSMRWRPYPHQLRAIWRIMQTGNTYMAHAVGAGKTMASIISAMEQKRLGMIRRPMFVVPNHMLEQFANEFMEFYPAAKILVADKENFIGDERRRFVAKASLGDWDAIIIKQSSFTLIGTEKGTREELADDFLADLQAALDDVDDSDRTTRKRLEAQIESFKQRVEKAGGGDANVTFEKMGVDFLYVDEAHTYRKLDYTTNNQIKGIDPMGSLRAFDMFVKLRYLDRLRPGRSVVMMSGTPITNTMAELYTVQRFMNYNGLVEAGLNHFDAWATTFGAATTEWDRDAAGNYQAVTRFAKFVNLPELMMMVRDFMDVLTMEQLGERVDRPIMKTGKPQMMTAPKSAMLEEYMKGELAQRLEISKKWKPSPDQPGNPDPILNIITDGRLAAIDMRFVRPGLRDDKGSKLNLMIDQIIEDYKATKDKEFTDKDGNPDKIKGATQIVFSALGFGEQVAKNRGFDAKDWMIKRLGQAGIPRSAIAFMGDYKTDVQKEAMFREMRDGKKRILVGSPQNMGTGLNVQKRLASLHFLAPPWYPADVEQPHGRILRQGNQNTEADIRWYVTEGTYDSTQWGMVRRKGTMIEQAFRGDKSIRTVEDLSEVGMYAMAEAVASGDNRVIQLAGLKAEIERFERLRNAHFGDQQVLKQKKFYAESELKRAREKLAEAEKALEILGDDYHSWSPATVEIDGKKFTKPGESGKALIARLKDILNKDDDYAGSRKRFNVGKIEGHDIVAEYRPAEKKDPPTVGVSVKIGPMSPVVLWQHNARDLDGLDDVGTGQKLRHALDAPGKQKAESKDTIAESERIIKQTGSRIGTPFEYANNLAQAIADAAQLERDLTQADKKAAEELKPAEEPESNPPAFMRARNPHALRQYKGRSGRPVFENESIALVLPKRGAVDGNFAYELHDSARVRAGDPDSRVGMVELDVDPDGTITGLNGLWINNDLRTSRRDLQRLERKGYGEKVVRAILATLPDGARLKIFGVVPNARGFWEKMGIEYDDTGRLLDNGFITRGAYERQRGEISPGDSGLVFSRGSGIQAPDDRGRESGSRSGLQDDGADAQQVSALRFATGPASAGLSVSAVRRAAAAVTKDWTNAPRVEVIQSLDYAPADVLALNAEQTEGGALQPPMAFFSNGRVWLVADALKTPAQVVHAIFHETLGHYGLRGLYGRELQTILGEVSMSRRADVRAKAIEYGLDPSSEADMLVAAEEVLAELAENRPDLGIVQRAIAAIRRFLRSLGVTLELTDRDIVADYIMPARNFVERGVRADSATGLMPAAAMRGGMALDEVLQEYGESVPSRMDAERRFSAGDRIFVAHEMTEGDDVWEIKNIGEMEGYAPDQMLVVPRELAHLLPDSDAGAAFSRADQTNTPEFRRWFGDSKVVDADGKPLVVYHGTGETFTEFESYKNDLVAGFFTPDPKFAGDFAHSSADSIDYTMDDPSDMSGGANIIPVYLRVLNPFDYDNLQHVAELTAEVEKNRSHLSDYSLRAELNALRTGDYTVLEDESMIAAMKKLGFDGFYVNEGVPGKENVKNIAVFRPEQIKSAVGNRGTFDPGNPDIRFSRGTDGLQLNRNADDGTRYQVIDRQTGKKVGGPYKNRLTARRARDRMDNEYGGYRYSVELIPGTMGPAEGGIRFSRATTAARETLADVFESSRTFNRWWHTTVGTQQHKAKVNSAFRAVYDESQDFLGDVSRFANEAADRAPDLLPRIDELKDVLQKEAPDAKDMQAVTEALYGGTLYAGGNPMDGVVWTDDELRGIEGPDRVLPFQFNLTDRQIKLYRQALASVRQSLDELGKSLIHRQGKIVGISADRELDLDGMADEIRQQIDEEMDDASEARAAQLQNVLAAVNDIVEKTVALKRNGYFPAMRFGRYATQVVEPDEAGVMRQVYFALYETQFEANRAKRELAREFPNGKILQGVMSQEGWRLYQGLSLDAVQLFADHMVDATGKPLLDEPAVQEFLRAAMNDRSVMKRHIRRKGIEGYSKDAQRVLAHFTLSASRAASSQYHMASMLNKADEIRAGDVKDEAVKLVKYLQDPQEEAGWVRGFLFFQYLGGSVASAAVNMTQPAMVTAPFLSQFTSYKNAAAKVATAARDFASGKPLAKGLTEALKRAKEEGIVSPQEIHQLRAEAERPVGGNLKLRKFMHVWGALFSLAEQFNRATTFIAAYRIAVENGDADAYGFAKNAVEETQFVYNKASRPNWARGTIGSTVFTFKQFSISYVELAKRVYGKDKVAFAIMMLTLMAAAGIEGLPFAEDIEDVIDTVGQWLGYNTNTKRALRRYVGGLLGNELGEIVLHGVSGIPGMPIDVSARMGMHNLLPGTAILKPSETNKMRDVQEFVGPIGGVAKAVGDGAQALAQGKVGAAAGGMLPTALKNVMKGIEMAQTGEYRDTQGRKVMDATYSEALAKMVGFQPANVARESRAMGRAMQDINLNRMVEDGIADKWARGIADRNPDVVEEARQELRDWNEKNPDSRIRINMQQLQRRVKEMRKSRSDRFVKTAPKELRGQVRDTMLDK